MIPLKVPRKIETVYDHGTPDEQTVVTYTTTVYREAFLKTLRVLKHLPFRMEYVKWEDRNPGFGYQFTRKYGLLVESDRIGWYGLKYYRRIILDCCGQQNGRTLFYQKRDRKSWWT